MERRTFLTGASATAVLAMRVAHAQSSPHARALFVPEASPEHLVAYIQVGPTSTEAAAKLLVEYRKYSRENRVVEEFEVFRRIGFPYHYVIYAQWTDAGGNQSHYSSGDTKRFRASLAKYLSAPVDERPLTVLSAGQPVDPKGRLIAITHVDFLPPVMDAGIASVKLLADQSRGVAGNMRYDAFAQSGRPNHVFFLETWRDGEAYSRNLTAKPLMDFRQSLLPRLGSLYDERLYEVLP